MNYWLSLGLLLAVGIPATGFCLLYAYVAPWWRSREGVHLFGFTATIAALLDLSAVVVVCGPFPGILSVSLLLYAAVAVFMWQRLWLLVTSQACLRRRRNNR